MAYDTELEKRIDRATEQWEEPLVKKKMFGGIGYMIYGNMCFGVIKDQLLLRAGEAEAVNLLATDGIRLFDMGGKPMKNWYYVSPEAIAHEATFQDILHIGHAFALTLPPK